MDKNSYRIALAIKLDGTATGCLNVGYGQQLHDLLKEASRALLDSNDGPNGEAQDAARYRWLKANHLQTGPDSWIRTGDDLEEAIDEGMRHDATGDQS